MRIAVYGASGYQGKLVIAELARRGIDTTLLGRDAERLRHAALTAATPGSPRRVAPLDDPNALVAALRGCDAVVNCAGPFSGTGAAVVDAAIAAGCHYVDTAGEQHYVKAVFDRFGEKAARRGVTVVPSTNDGCLPVDLVAHLIGERAPSLDEITSSHVIDGDAVSRGTARSALAIADRFGTGGLTYAGGDWHEGLPQARASIVLPGATEPTHLAKAPVAEVVTIPRHVAAGRVEGLIEATLAARLRTPISPALVDALPEGPTAQARHAQRFTYVVDASIAGGHPVRGVVDGTDTYGTTAVIAAEAARLLAEGGAKAGVLAPAQAFDPAGFLGFLHAHGLTWRIDWATS